MTNTASIHISWDQSGNLSHRYSGMKLAPPKDDRARWMLAPSAPLFLAHQFGSMKPSQGLIAAGHALDMLFHDRYVLMPINSALKSGRLDFIYTGGPSTLIRFHPKHSLFVNSDSVEEGVRQLVNNYMYYVYKQFDVYMQASIRLFVTLGAFLYFEFLEGLVKEGSVGTNRDNWMPSFTLASAEIRHAIGSRFLVPSDNPHDKASNDEWLADQREHMDRKLAETEEKKVGLMRSFGVM